MRDHQMRTSPQLDDDVLAARLLARQRRTSLGAVISALSLLPWNTQGAPVDLEPVNSLRDQPA
jgi:hypothetical protein